MPLLIAALVVAALATLPWYHGHLIEMGVLPDPLRFDMESYSLLLGAIASYLFLHGLWSLVRGRPTIEKSSVDPDKVEAERRATELEASLSDISGRYREAVEAEARLKQALEQAERRAAEGQARAVSEDRTTAEVVNLLALFQSRGRFIDFLMQEVTPYSDAQVGTVARFVHQGCRSVLKEHFDIQVVHEATEGTRVALDRDFDGRLYRLSGKIGGPAPIAGTLVHKGWKTSRVTVPRVSGEPILPFVIAPAELEVKA